MTPKPYKTLMKRGCDEFIVNKSRFIGHGAPCADEAEALAYLAASRKRYGDASHNCYAYILGVNRGVMRYSDDGEPGGTAGMPIIEVLKARDVTNCCVVVTRYFGGVLLGAGGLTRAYAQGAAVALDACGVGVMYPTARYLVELPYPLLGRVEYRLKDLPALIEDKTFTDAVTLQLIVRVSDEARVIAEITSATDGRAASLRIEEDYMAWTT